MDLKLASQRALVTGAGSGLGIAWALAAEGTDLVLAGRNRARLESAAKDVERISGKIPHIICADLGTNDGVSTTLQQITRHWDVVDILVNNAGGSRPIAKDEDDNVWQESFNLNFMAARRLSNGLVEGMKRNSFGRIINITGATLLRTMNAASPIKAALQSWSRMLAFELAPHGITVNCVSPGRINSVQILEKLHPTEESRRCFIEQNIPAGHFGEPENIGDLINFLASPRASYITGVTIPVDGGMLRLAF